MIFSTVIYIFKYHCWCIQKAFAYFVCHLFKARSQKSKHAEKFTFYALFANFKQKPSLMQDRMPQSKMNMYGDALAVAKIHTVRRRCDKCREVLFFLLGDTKISCCNLAREWESCREDLQKQHYCSLLECIIHAERDLLFAFFRSASDCGNNTQRKKLREHNPAPRSAREKRDLP